MAWLTVILVLVALVLIWEIYRVPFKSVDVSLADRSKKRKQSNGVPGPLRLPVIGTTYLAFSKVNVLDRQQEASKKVYHFIASSVSLTLMKISTIKLGNCLVSWDGQESFSPTDRNLFATCW